MYAETSLPSEEEFIVEKGVDGRDEISTINRASSFWPCLVIQFQAQIFFTHGRSKSTKSY